MCKEDWCVRLGQEGGSLREDGGNCLKYLKKGWGWKQKIKEERTQAKLRGGCFKKGAGTPLWTMDCTQAVICQFSGPSLMSTANLWAQMQVSLSYSNGIRICNHLVCKWTLNHLAKLANMQLESKLSRNRTLLLKFLIIIIWISETRKCDFSVSVAKNDFLGTS